MVSGRVVLCQLDGAAGQFIVCDGARENLLVSLSSIQGSRDVEIQQIPGKLLPQFGSGVPVRQVIPKGLISEMWRTRQFVTL